jgi:hypothetical protein
MAYSGEKSKYIAVQKNANSPTCRKNATALGIGLGDRLSTGGGMFSAIAGLSQDG